MTRRQLRAEYNHAYKCWLAYRTLKWKGEVRRLNLELMKMDVARRSAPPHPYERMARAA